MPRERIGDVELYYEIHGEGGEDVAFVNGVAMTVQSWAPIRKRFQDDSRCILHDTRGQLMSEKPSVDYSMEMHAEDMKNLFDHLGVRKVHLAGTSYGSEIAMIFAFTYPERVKTLQVIAGASELDGVLRAATESWAVAARHGAVPFFRSMLPWAYSSEFIDRNGAMLSERERLLSQLPGEFFEGFTRLVKAFHGLNITAQLGRITCPTLVVAAENDIIKPPRFSEIIHRRIPGSEYVVMRGSGHAVVVEDPAGLSEVMRAFIAKHRSN